MKSFYANGEGKFISVKLKDFSKKKDTSIIYVALYI